MKVHAILAAVVFLAVTAPPAAKAQRLFRQWVTEAVFETPESVCWDEEREILYVSNIAGKSNEKNGRGFISRLSLKGEVKKLRWITGLDAPKGMGVYRGRLYVADIDHLVEIDIRSDRVVRRHPAEGAVFLNDVAVDGQGRVYVSDSSADNSVIYRLEGDTLSLWVRDPALRSPNGLCVDGGRLVVGNSGDGTLKSIALADGTVHDLVAVGSPIDGVRIDRRGNYLVSDWSGRTLLIEPSGMITILLDTTARKINAADIEFIPGEDLLLIPTFHDNRVFAGRIVY